MPNETKHTPGPLTVKHEYPHSLVLSADGETVAKVYGKTNLETEANARLIAAAPELLAIAIKQVDIERRAGLFVNAGKKEQAQLNLERVALAAESRAAIRKATEASNG